MAARLVTTILKTRTSRRVISVNSKWVDRKIDFRRIPNPRTRSQKCPHTDKAAALFHFWNRQAGIEYREKFPLWQYLPKNVLPLRPAKLLLDLLFCSSFHHQRVEHILFVQSKFLARCHLVLQHLLKSNPNKAFFPTSSRVPLSTYCWKKTRQEESPLQNQSNHYQQSCSLHRQVQKTNYWSKQCGIEI